LLKPAKQIIEEMQSVDNSKQERSRTANLLKAIIKNAKQFFTDLFKTLANKLTKNKFDVEVKNPTKLPDIFKIDGSVSIKDTKALLIGLNEIVRGIEATKKHYENQTKQLEKSLKPEKVDFTKLEKAINDIYIPDPIKEISITNFTDYTKQLDLIKKEISKLKLNPEIKVNNPAPKVSIDLEGVKSRLEAVVEALTVKEDEPIGYSWTKNSEGNLSTFTEIYPDKKIISIGWDIGRVEINEK